MDEKLIQEVADEMGMFSHYEDLPSGRRRICNLTEEQKFIVAHCILAIPKIRDALHYYDLMHSSGEDWAAKYYKD
jgi:hypothetical protein